MNIKTRFEPGDFAKSHQFGILRIMRCEVIVTGFKSLHNREKMIQYRVYVLQSGADVNKGDQFMLNETDLQVPTPAEYQPFIKE